MQFTVSDVSDSICRGNWGNTTEKENLIQTHQN